MTVTKPTTLNVDMYINTDGLMVGGKPSLYVLHNDAGSMSARDYLSWLRTNRAPGTNKAALGFAHYYGDRNTMVRVQNTTRIAWAMGNYWANQRALSYEVCQQFSASDAQWIANEDAVLMQMAEDMTFYGAKPNGNNIKFHHEYSSTSCPARSMQVHGRTEQMRAYVIAKIQKYQSLGKTVSEMVRALNSGKSDAVEVERPKTSNKSIKTSAQIVDEVLAGKWGTGDDRKTRLEKAGFNYSLIQDAVNLKAGFRSNRKKTIKEVAQEVINGAWGIGDERKKRLAQAGYNYSDVQNTVNRILVGAGGKSVTEIAYEVIAGNWSSGDDRKIRLVKSGFDYNAIQNEVNRILGFGNKSIETLAREVLDGHWGNEPERSQRLKKVGYDANKVQSRVNQLLG